MEGRNIKRRMKKYHWLIILCITTLVAMYIYGMTKIYFPEPLDIGFGQYLDLGTGIVIFCLVISGFIIAIIFKKNKKEVR